MQTSVQPPTQRDASCAASVSVTTAASATATAASATAASATVAGLASVRTPLFPPRDADLETRRRWLATSPWPEVVFASAGAV